MNKLSRYLDETLKEKFELIDSLAALTGDRRRIFEEWSNFYDFKVEPISDEEKKFLGDPLSRINEHDFLIPSAVMARTDSIRRANNMLQRRYFAKANNDMSIIASREPISLEILGNYARVLQLGGTLNDANEEREYIELVDWLNSNRDNGIDRIYYESKRRIAEGLYKRLNPAYSGGNENE